MNRKIITSITFILRITSLIHYTSIFHTETCLVFFCRMLLNSCKPGLWTILCPKFDEFSSSLIYIWYCDKPYCTWVVTTINSRQRVEFDAKSKTKKTKQNKTKQNQIQKQNKNKTYKIIITTTTTLSILQCRLWTPNMNCIVMTVKYFIN